MSDAPRYVIRTVADFLKVPEDRRAACLAEFPRCLEYLAAICTIVSGSPVPKNAEYVWIDDGETKIRHIKIRGRKGKEIARLNINYKDDRQSHQPSTDPRTETP